MRATRDKHGSTLTRSPSSNGNVDLLRSCKLRPSGPIVIRNNHSVTLSFLHVQSRAEGGAAITCKYSHNVTLSNLLVEHVEGAIGIQFHQCHNLRVEDVAVRVWGRARRAEPARCLMKYNGCDNVQGFRSRLPAFRRVSVEGGSSGINLNACPHARLSRIVARNMHGPYPRGQCVQLGESHGATLEHFHCVNEMDRSWPEDSISVWRSKGVAIRYGLVDGNNAPNGVGVMFENDDTRATGGIVEAVDAIQMGGGCFSAYPASGLLMRRTRCGWNHCHGTGGREKPSSGGQMWAAGDQPRGVQGFVGSHGVRIVNATYWSACDAVRSPFWSKSAGAYAARPDIRRRPFKVRAPVRFTPCWEQKQNLD